METTTRWANVSADGAVTVMEAPLHYRIRPYAFGVLVPARNGHSFHAAVLANSHIKVIRSTLTKINARSQSSSLNPRR